MNLQTMISGMNGQILLVTVQQVLGLGRQTKEATS